MIIRKRNQDDLDYFYEKGLETRNIWTEDWTLFTLKNPYDSLSVNLKFEASIHVRGKVRIFFWLSDSLIVDIDLQSRINLLIEAFLFESLILRVNKKGEDKL